jgi:hypothetical protein
MEAITPWGLREFFYSIRVRRHYYPPRRYINASALSHLAITPSTLPPKFYRVLSNLFSTTL